MNTNKKDQAFIYEWNQSRAKGKTRFILACGATFFLGLNLVHIVLNNGEFFSTGFSYLFDGIRLPLYIIMTVGYAFYKWSQNEKKYERVTNEMTKTALL